MEVTISADGIIKLAALLAAVGGIGGLVVWCIKFVDRQKKQDQELTAIRKEQTLICYGVMACLRGLKANITIAFYKRGQVHDWHRRKA